MKEQELQAPMANAIDDVKEWVLVPKIETDEQCDAGLEALRENLGHSAVIARDAAACYRAMLAAAPASPAAPSQHTGWSDEAIEAAAGCIKGGSVFDHDERLAMARAALSAASSIAKATGFEVKALEWVQVIPGRLAADIYVVERVYLDEWCFKIWEDKPAGMPKTVAGHLTLEAAKAAAEADHRFRSSISHSARVERAFRDGLAYGSNVANADPDIAWQQSKVRAELQERSS